MSKNGFVGEKLMRSQQQSKLKSTMRKLTIEPPEKVISQELSQWLLQVIPAMHKKSQESFVPSDEYCNVRIDGKAYLMRLSISEINASSSVLFSNQIFSALTDDVCFGLEKALNQVRSLGGRTEEQRNTAIFLLNAFFSYFKEKRIDARLVDCIVSTIFLYDTTESEGKCANEDFRLLSICFNPLDFLLLIDIDGTADARYLDTQVGKKGIHYSDVFSEMKLNVSHFSMTVAEIVAELDFAIDSYLKNDRDSENL